MNVKCSLLDRGRSQDDVLDCAHAVDGLTRVYEPGAHSLKLHSPMAGGVRTVRNPYWPGYEVNTTGRISGDTTRKVVKVAREHEGRGTIAIATSPVRDAENRMRLVRQVPTTLQAGVLTPPAGRRLTWGNEWRLGGRQPCQTGR